MVKIGIERTSRCQPEYRKLRLPVGGREAYRHDLTVGLEREIEDLGFVPQRGRGLQIERACSGNLTDESVGVAGVVIRAPEPMMNFAARDETPVSVKRLDTPGRSELRS